MMAAHLFHPGIVLKQVDGFNFWWHAWLPRAACTPVCWISAIDTDRNVTADGIWLSTGDANVHHHHHTVRPLISRIPPGRLSPSFCVTFNKDPWSWQEMQGDRLAVILAECTSYASASLDCRTAWCPNHSSRIACNYSPRWCCVRHFSKSLSRWPLLWSASGAWNSLRSSLSGSS